MNNQHINFLKGIAVLCVFVLHFSLASPQYKPFFMYTPAWVGVWIFFILSGYLIGKSFWQERYKVTTIKDFGIFIGIE